MLDEKSRNYSRKNASMQYTFWRDSSNELSAGLMFIAKYEYSVL